MDELFENEVKEVRSPKHVGRLYRKLFLLVLAIALLGQAILLMEKGLSNYYQQLSDSFKIILTVEQPAEAAQLEQWGQTLNQKQDIAAVRLFSPEDALAVVRHKNPQLVDSLLQLGKNQMPSYFEITLVPAAVRNVRPLVDNLAAEYEVLTPHYNMQHAQLLFYVGLYTKLLRVLGALSLLGFIGFMFLVEAADSKHPHAWGGLVAGLLAAVLSATLVVAVLYPAGLLNDALALFTTWHRQVLLLVFCGLLGWTLSKWQKF